MNPTAELADVVLPVASAFEREALKIGFDVSPEAQSLIQLRPAVVPPPGEARPDTDIVFDLAGRLGLGDAVLERRHRRRLPPPARPDRRHAWSSCVPAPVACGCRLEARYAKYAEPDPTSGAPRGFATPSRKVELYSQTFLDHGYAPLPDFEEPPIGPAARPDLAARFPLVLTSAKPTLFCQTQHRALPSLRKRALDPEVEIASGRGAGARHCRWRLGLDRDAGRQRARARPLQRQPRPARRRRRARLVAGVRRTRRSRVRPVRAARRQLQPAHRHRGARSGQRHRLAPLLSVRDPPSRLSNCGIRSGSDPTLGGRAGLVEPASADHSNASGRYWRNPPVHGASLERQQR